MIIEIELKKGSAYLKLKKGKLIIDCVEFIVDNNLSVIMLEKIDALIGKNDFTKRDIKTISVKSDLPDSYTSGRIAKSLERSWNFASKSECRHPAPKCYNIIKDEDS